MMKKRLSKKIWYGSDVDSEGNPVLPPLAIDSDDLEGLHYGELYLHIADDKLSLWTRTLTDQVKQIGGSGSGDGELWQLRQTDTGEPYLFSPFDVAVQRGLTSFVDGGSLDLPSIYDGLPIDNQTLYWEEVTEQVGTDEEGNPIYETTKVLKAAGGGTGGGGVADSVHWNNIEGKPDFSQYATKDSLSGYLPLSGGTMTGQINMPVGIGNAIKFGEESRLFTSNGNFYISAETHLIFASGASGNNVPNNVVINKDGRMFIANNLAVGHAGFIMDSYKLNVAGDAYVNGKLVVSGTIYPSISSLHNIGDPSKRFACIHADSVDVGGVKIRLLQDGVLLIDGNLAVTGGITSYVDGGDLDLPSIYDGLPIDGDTLYWVLDDNGKKVMLKSKGGNDEGGGSVKFHLTWSGFSEGSWNGSEAKAIVIPSKLSELENDGFFKDYGWVQGDANEKKFGSHFLSGAVDNIPISNGQLLAFNGADGTQFFVWENHFYHRQNWGGGWHGWRKVISGDSNGVIDYDLTLGGNLTINGEEYNEIKTVYNPDFSIGNLEELGWKTAIRHALRFRWHDDAYEIGTVRSNTADAWGFGVTYQNNQLVWRVDREQMDVYGDLRLKGGLIQYNEEKGYFYLEGNLVVSGGITSYVDVGNLNLPSIYDGLPIDKTTIGWKEVTDASGAKSKVLGIIGDIDDTVIWSDIEGIPSWIGSSKPSYSYSEINGTPDLTKYAQKTEIPSLSGYATQAWVEKQGYAKSSDIPNLDGYAKLTHLSDYLPLSGVLPSSEFTLQGDLRLQKGNGTSERKLVFGDGYNAYLYESPNNFLNIYADSGVKIYDNTTNFKEYIEMTRSGITLSTTSSSYISMAGQGIKVNNGVITYNEDGGYFELDGNLLVTGGITAFADSGAGNQWILDATSLSGVTSTNQYKVYSARVTSKLATEVINLQNKMNAIKDALAGISGSSSLKAIGDALNSIYSALN